MLYLPDGIEEMILSIEVSPIFLGNDPELPLPNRATLVFEPDFCTVFTLEDKVRL